jgi:hypothetical protein
MTSARWIPTDSPSNDFTFEREVDQVLFEYDGPRIFTSRAGPWLLLWYQITSGADGAGYLIAPTKVSTIHGLEVGTITLREALDQPISWVADFLPGSPTCAKSWRVSTDDLPPRLLPKPHVMLRKSAEPWFSLRLLGENISPGRVHVSVIKRGVDGAYRALKKAADSVEGFSHGRPGEAFRKLYDLPAQRFAFGSFEIAFGSPFNDGLITDDNEVQDKLNDMGSRLSGAIEWVMDGRAPSLKPSIPDLHLLEAVELLAPPAEGDVELVELRGQMISARSGFKLTRDVGRNAKAAIKHLKSLEKETPLTQPGFVREFDKDRLSFILRDQAGSDLYYCSLPSDLYDTGLDAFREGSLVFVTGLVTGKAMNVRLISQLEPERPSAN